MGEIIRSAVSQINQQGDVSLITWEDCRIGGKLLIKELCDQIDQKAMFCAHLTHVNPNVMFELGYSIAKNKRVWLLLDTSVISSRRQFEQLRLLTTVGYRDYRNSGDVVSAFAIDKPQEDLQNTIFEKAIRPLLAPAGTPSLFYLKSPHETEASVRVTKRVHISPIEIISDDPRESSVQTLAWYGTQVYKASAVVCHLSNPDREGSQLHTARHALIAGMALGLGKPLLMLAEGDFLAPLDYRDILRNYHTASQAHGELDTWLRSQEDGWRSERTRATEYARNVRLATELKGLQLGEPIAEHEVDRLVQDYFLETKPYREALEGNRSLFVGRKGCGKTANFLKLSAELKKDKRNLVCVIKPVAYELEGILEVLKRYRERDAKGFAIESLWKFLLYTEMAKAVYERIAAQTGGASTVEEEAFIRSIKEDESLITDEFSVRLERALQRMLDSKPSGDGSEAKRVAISEALHQGVLKKLKSALSKALVPYKRVAVLIDNLDKAWDKQADLGSLAEFLFGLLGATNRVGTDLAQHEAKRPGANITLTVFLRSDIFDQIRGVAREPDKIQYSRLSWDDSEALMRVLEERFINSHEGMLNAAELWTRYVCPTVQGTETRKYLLETILPRPRDLLYFVKAALSTAINRGHGIIEELDIVEAERQYSQFAFESMLVESNHAESPLFEKVVYQFAGVAPILSSASVRQCLWQVVPSDETEAMVKELCTLGFLGMEIRKNEFRFVENPQDYEKAIVQATRFTEGREVRMRYRINPAFWAFLEIERKN